MKDEELLRKAFGGDQESFQELYLRHRDALYRFALSLLGTVPAAEDAVHDCFVALLNTGKRFDAKRGTVQAYLFGIVRHLALRQLRKSGREAHVLPEEILAASPAGSQSDPLHCVLHAERQRLLQAAMLKLSVPQRQVLALFEHHELTLEAISSMVGVDTGAVKARLHRARKSLQKWTAQLLRSRYEY